MYNWDMTELQKLPIDSSKTETIKILKAENKAVKMLAELKGCANLIPNQSILINAVVLQESKDSSEIENIITTKDDLYKAVSETVKKIDSATKEVMFYREALYTGFNQLKEHDFLSINDIVQIQKVLVQNDAGIRTLPGTKLVNDTTNEVVYTPPQTKEEIDELMPTTHKNLETTADEQGDFYLERDRLKRKKQLETYICTHLQHYWESLPKEMAKLDRQLLKTLLDSI